MRSRRRVAAAAVARRPRRAGRWRMMWRPGGWTSSSGCTPRCSLKGFLDPFLVSTIVTGLSGLSNSDERFDERFERDLCSQDRSLRRSSRLWLRNSTKRTWRGNRAISAVQTTRQYPPSPPVVLQSRTRTYNSRVLEMSRAITQSHSTLQLSLRLLLLLLLLLCVCGVIDCVLGRPQAPRSRPARYHGLRCLSEHRRYRLDR